MGTSLLTMTGVVIFLYVVALPGLMGSMIPTESQSLKARDERVLPLFAVVTFKNNKCTGTNGLTGTCYSTTDCNSKGGSTSGNCAAGFGVCCIVSITACGGTVSQNNTYIANSGYPATLASVTSCQFSVNYCNSNICQLRLDFDNMVLTPGTNGDVSAANNDSEWPNSK